MKRRACLTTTMDGVLLRANDVHNHKPPRFIIHNGIYTKLLKNSDRSFQWVHNRCGKELLVFGGYSFYQQQRNRKTDRWACTSLGGVRNCRARIMVTKDRNIVDLLDAHNHAPPKYLIENGIFFSTSGKDILLLGGFSYYMQSQAKTTARWVCTSNSGVRKCRARVLLTKDRQVASLPSAPHSHPPPNIVIHNGICFKV
ncbi:FLYWCH zinc finger domain-containing protein [Phthorimaea operculella]|nr:FLYWCH zinc finger domain-containing protein [Phthorimaea operculella]